MALNGQIFTATIDHMHNSGMLAPGAKDRLILESERSNKLTPAERVGELLAFLLGDDPQAKAYLHPRFKWPEDTTLLHRMLECLPLASGARDRLALDWHMDLISLEPETMATRLIDRLGERDNWHRLAPDVRPDPPLSEQRVREAVNLFREDLKPGTDIDLLVKRWASMGHGAQHEVNIRIAQTLEKQTDLHRWQEGIQWDVYAPPFRPAPMTPEQQAEMDALLSQRGALL